MAAYFRDRSCIWDYHQELLPVFKEDSPAVLGNYHALAPTSNPGKQ